MAKPFGKRPNDWLNLKSTKEFVDILTATRKNGSVHYQAVKTESGGMNANLTGGGCTWFQKELALEYARYLKPEFGIWCNDRIEE